MSVMNTDPIRPQWALDPAVVTAACSDFIRTTVKDAGLSHLVVGLSGGIDSAVAAGLAVAALGPDRVRGIMMPYATSSEASISDAEAVALTLGMPVEKTPITPMADAFLAHIPEQDKVRRGNIMARCRMVVLYDRSARDGSLVLGTGNRTESLLGYTTLFGDSACALNPIGQLYKTEVRLLSAHLGLPKEVLTKAPSADLWTGQSDEDELGFTYAQADEVLHRVIDLGEHRSQVVEAGFDGGLVDRITARVRAMAFKRLPVPVAVFDGRPDPDRTADRQAKDGGFH